MELNTESGFLVSNKSLEKVSFKINASAKAFKILSDGLYTNKIKAIIRELSCNAWDAHKAAGTSDKKFDLHLPTVLSPEFKIRDYGTGLSKEDVEHVYTTYFESTKTDSNDLIGCLGLGSKTPFCYSDNFTVISYFNGKKNTYNVFLDEREMPSCSLISEADTSEPNGLEIKMAVKTKDVHNFVSNARSVFFWFETVPNIYGDSSGSFWSNFYSSILNEKEVLRKDSYTLVPKRLMNNIATSNIIAVMGNIAYEIRLSDLDEELIRRNVVLGSGSYLIVLNLNIGDVEIAASREALSLDKKTKEVITTALKNIDNEYLTLLKDKVLSADTWLNACSTYIDILNSIMNYNTRDAIKSYFGNFKKDNKLIVETITFKPIKTLIISDYQINIKSDSYSTNQTIDNIKKSIIVNVSSDGSGWSESKLRTFLRNYNATVDKSVKRLMIVGETFSEEWLKDNDFPLSKYFKYDSLPKIQVEKQASSSYVREGKKSDQSYYVYDSANKKINLTTFGYDDVVNTAKKKIYDKNTKTKIYYVEIDSKRRVIDLERKSMSSGSIRYLIDYLGNLCDFKEDVIALTATQTKAAKENKNMINVFDYFEMIKSEIANSEDYLNYIKLRRFYIEGKIPEKRICPQETINLYYPEYQKIINDRILEFRKQYFDARDKIKRFYLDNTKEIDKNITEENNKIIDQFAKEETEKYEKERIEIENKLPNISCFYLNESLLYTYENKRAALEIQLKTILEEECIQKTKEIV